MLAMTNSTCLTGVCWAEEYMNIVFWKGLKMIITGKRKRTLDIRLRSMANGVSITPGVLIDKETEKKLGELGFSDNPKPGDTILPPPSFGPVTRYNAEGKVVVHRDKPMETAYRQVEWTWEQWAGRYETETQSRIVDVPYKRYPRTRIPPPSVELSLRKNKEGNLFLVAPALKLNKKEPGELVHEINVLLEIFGHCQIFTEKLISLVPSKIVRVNWRILPPGRWPWKKVEKEVDPIVRKAAKQNQIVIRYRLTVITQYLPEFVAIGEGGFTGYLIFGFPKKNLYVLESVYTGNATYVFEEDWEELSKLTKAEILLGKLQKDRIIHREGWEGKIYELMKKM